MLFGDDELDAVDEVQPRESQPKRAFAVRQQGNDELPLPRTARNESFDLEQELGELVDPAERFRRQPRESHDWDVIPEVVTIDGMSKRKSRDARRDMRYEDDDQDNGNRQYDDRVQFREDREFTGRQYRDNRQMTPEELAALMRRRRMERRSIWPWSR